MPSSRERRSAALIHAAPLLGIPVQLGLMSAPGSGWNFTLLFSLGTVMLLCAMVAALLGTVLTAPEGFVGAHARGAWRFQSWLTVIALVVFGLVALALVVGRPGASGAAPQLLQSALGLAAIYSGLVLPVLELGWVGFAGRRALRGQWP